MGTYGNGIEGAARGMTIIKFIPLILAVFLLSACAGDEAETGAAAEKSEAQSDPGYKTVVHAESLRAEMEKNELVNESDIIVSGTVLSQTVESDFSGFPATDTLIEVEHRYKGNSADEIEVRSAGGETDDMIYVVEDTAEFIIGEKVILFLSRNGGSRPNEESFYYTVGQAGGKFSVDSSGQGMTRNNQSDFQFDLDNLQAEIDELEHYNQTHNVPRLLLPEGEESDI